MNRILVVRPSSLGDIVHALPIVHDLHRHRPGVEIDWVVEEPFIDLVGMTCGVRRVIAIALRRWRRGALARSTWGEMRAFRRELAHERYDAVIDLQEQVKGALIAWFARGPVHGPDRASVREPAATLFYRHRYRINPQQHLIDRCRQLAGKALGYAPAGPPHVELRTPALRDPPPAPYAVFVHATSRADKLWPEADWRGLLEHLSGRQLSVVLPWGTPAEAARSERLAAGSSNAIVPGRLELPELAALLARAAVVVGVDTGLTHLAAALSAPTIALFVATDPRLAGVARLGAHARDLGGVSHVPALAEVVAATDLLQGRRAVAR
ncbi:MAG TPA: lipopolysaccharide heptosyltransferase I [Casimicrobiaceae bacterium]